MDNERGGDKPKKYVPKSEREMQIINKEAMQNLLDAIFNTNNAFIKDIAEFKQKYSPKKTGPMTLEKQQTIQTEHNRELADWTENEAGKMNKEWTKLFNQFKGFCQQHGFEIDEKEKKLKPNTHYHALLTASISALEFFTYALDQIWTNLEKIKINKAENHPLLQPEMVQNLIQEADDHFQRARLAYLNLRYFLSKQTKG